MMATKKKLTHPVTDRIDVIIAGGHLAPLTVALLAEQMGVTELLAEARSDPPFLNYDEGALLERFAEKIEIEAAKSAVKPDLKVVGGKDVDAEPDAADEPKASEKVAEPGKILTPNREDILAHLWAYFGPKTIAPGSPIANGLIEVVWSKGPNEPPTSARMFGTFDLPAIADFVIEKNSLDGHNCYIGATLRHPDTAPFGRSVKEDFFAATSCFVDLDKPGTVATAIARAKELGLRPSYVVQTGTMPDRRAQVHFVLDKPLTDPEQLETLNKLLIAELDADKGVWNSDRLIRLGGTITYPSSAKRLRGYIDEVTQFKAASKEAYSVDQITRVYGTSPRNATAAETSAEARRTSRLGLSTPEGRADSDVQELLDASRVQGQWHHSMLAATATLIGRGYSDQIIRMLCAPYCDGGANDPDLSTLIVGGRRKWDKPDPSKAGVNGGAADDDSDESWGNSGANKETRQKTIAAAPFVYCAPETLPRREFLYGTHLIRKFLSATIAPGGRGKSSLLMAEAIDMASGGKVFRIATQKLRVWVWNGEDPHDEMMRKALATMKHYNVTQADVEGYLFLNSGRDSEIIIGVETKSGMVINEPVVEDMIETILANKIDVVQIDPFVSSHRVSENDNTKIDAVAKTFGKIADKTNCAIDLSHHVRKGGPGVVTDISSDDARGAGAMLNAARASRVLNPAALKDAPFLVEAGEAFEPRLHFRVDDGKMNLAKPSSEARWFKLTSVSLDNGSKFQRGDEVGVPVRVALKGVLDGVTERHLARVQARLMTMPDGMMKDFRSPHWIGHLVGEVSGLDSKAPGMSAKIDKIVGVWVSTGALVEVTKARKKDKREQVWVKCGNIE